MATIAFHYGNFGGTTGERAAAAQEGRVFADTLPSEIPNQYGSLTTNPTTDDDDTTYSWTPPTSATADILVVAGGGGGAGGFQGGGGGAGGLRYEVDNNVISGTIYSIVVGAGGVGGRGGGVPESRVPQNGYYSSAVGLIAFGGGSGAQENPNKAAQIGGSGGGGAHGGGVPGADGTSGQGNKGGDGNSTSPNYVGGGGGGAGTMGTNATSTVAGNGGTGLEVFGTFYAGGGGGARRLSGVAGTQGLGGTGGGGNGGITHGSNGTPHTGGGGGGGASTTNGNGVGGNGGSGIVIIRLQDIDMKSPSIITGLVGWYTSQSADMNSSGNLEKWRDLSGKGNHVDGDLLKGNVKRSVDDTVGSPGQPILAFHHGNFTDTYGDGTVQNAAKNGRVYHNTTPSDVPSVYGSFTFESGTYSWTPPSSAKADVLVVAGGGGGGGRSGGGGGAGGLIYKLNNNVISGIVYPIVVGAGGVGGPGTGGYGVNGINSSFPGIIAVGGGGGASDFSGADPGVGLDGGSGGGGRYGGGGGAGETGPPKQGNNGGGSVGVVGGVGYYNGGGGGGAGQVGGDGTETVIGNGGDGIEVFGTFYAGGGGGGAHDPTPSGARGLGGLGGGGNGGDRANLINGAADGDDGVANTGGGGGAGTTNSGTGGKGGNGGSGIVLIRLRVNTGRGPTPFPFLYGSTLDGLMFPTAVMDTSSNYTLFHVARYYKPGGTPTRRRIFDGVTTNWLSGFWSNRSGVAYHGSWLTPQTNLHGTQWVLSTDQRNMYRSNGIDRTSLNYSGGTSSQLSINDGAFKANESSDWACAEVIVYDRELTADEYLAIEAYLNGKYFGFGRVVAPATMAVIQALFQRDVVVGSTNLSEFGQFPVSLTSFLGFTRRPGALDNISVHPIAAYALRRLFGFYGGPQVRVRRSSNDDEQDLFMDDAGNIVGFNLSTWLDGATAFVVTWYDQSGNGFHGTTNTFTHQPYLISTMDGYYLVPGDDTTQGGLNVTGAPLANMTGVTYITRVNFSKFGVTQGHPYYFRGSSNQHINWSNNNTYEQLGYSTRRNNPVPFVLNTWHTYSVRGPITGNTRVFLDTNEVTAFSNPFSDAFKNATPTLVGNIQSVFADRYKVSDQILFDTNISDTQWNNIKSILNPPVAGALDNISVQPIAAYALRRLFVFYGGPQVRVRRSGDNVEQDLFMDDAGNIIDFDFSTWLGAATAFVVTWYDQSGNGFHMRIVNLPELEYHLGEWCLNFNGNNQYGVCDGTVDGSVIGSVSNLGFGGSNPKTVWTRALVQEVGNTTAGLFDIGDTGEAGRHFSLRLNDSFTNWRAQFWADPDFDFTFDGRNTWNNYTTTSDGSTQYVYINSSQVGSKVGTLATAGEPFHLSIYTISDKRYFGGKNASCILFSSHLTTAESLELENMLNSSAPPPPPPPPPPDPGTTTTFLVTSTIDPSPLVYNLNSQEYILNIAGPNGPQTPGTPTASVSGIDVHPNDEVTLRVYDTRYNGYSQIRFNGNSLSAVSGSVNRSENDTFNSRFRPGPHYEYVSAVNKFNAVAVISWYIPLPSTVTKLEFIYTRTQWDGFSITI